MTARPAVWPRCHRSNGLATANVVPLLNRAVRRRRPHASRRTLASHTRSPQQPRFSEFMPLNDPSKLDFLLKAIQKQDVPRITQAFYSWTDDLTDPNSPYYEAAVREVQEIPGPVFSEILRNIDPALSPSHDVAHGLTISQGQTKFTDIGKLMNPFGVRKVREKILQGTQVLMDIRGKSHHGLTPSDCEIAIRCAGAAVDHHQAKAFWHTMAAHNLKDARTSKSWSEFIKARFQLEPVYYQFNRSRVAVLARDLQSNIHPIPMGALKRMDHMRFSINALLHEPWNRRPDEPEEDIRRLLRRRVGYRSYKGHWLRSLYYGTEMDEELLCVSMMAFARSSSVYSIKKMIFQDYYGITIDEARHPADTKISGGHDFPEGSATKPSPRLLHAIVEAFGSMSHVALGMKLVDYISHRYGIPIPHEIWSNLLNWTYVCASKPFRSMRKLHGAWQATAISTSDVRQVWDLMTSKPYNVTPSFEDLDVYIKTLLIQRSFGRAIEIIEEHAIPHYTTLVSVYESALIDEILQNDAAISISPTSTSSSRASRRRKHAELLKDHTHNLITTWFTTLLKSASAVPSNHTIITSLIPNLLLKHPQFFHPQLRYRTTQGVVQLTRPVDATNSDGDVVPRFEWEKSWRITLPQKKAGIYARDFEGSDEPDFEWPMIPQMKVMEWRKVPKRRVRHIGRPPPEGMIERKTKEWWDGVEEQMML